MLFDISGHEGRVLLEELQEHVNHTIEIAQYGKVDTHGRLIPGTLRNIGVECMDCYRVIVEVDNCSHEESGQSQEED